MRCAVDRLSDVGAWHALKQIRVVIEAVCFAWILGGGGGAGEPECDQVQQLMMVGWRRQERCSVGQWVSRWFAPELGVSLNRLKLSKYLCF